MNSKRARRETANRALKKKTFYDYFIFFPLSVRFMPAYMKKKKKILKMCEIKLKKLMKSFADRLIV